MTARAAAAALVALLALPATACAAAPSGIPTTRTLTEDQASQQAAERLADAARQLSPAAELVRLPDQDVTCTGLSNDGPAQLTIGRFYQVRGLDPARSQQYADQLRAYWTAQGYRATASTAPHPLVRVEHPEDRFTLSFEVRDGTAELSAVLSCIWPDGTPPPT